jgi:Spy/CpxP family protein refolding chaperone
MKRNLPWILLGLSVSLNLFFFIGFGLGYIERHRQTMPPAGQTPPAGNQTSDAKADINRIDLIAMQLDLTPQQKQKLELIRQNGAIPMRQLALQRLEVQRDLRLEWRKPSPDRAKIRDLVQRHGQLVGEMRTLAAEQFADFAPVLTPKQREKWTQWVSHSEKSEPQ